MSHKIAYLFVSLSVLLWASTASIGKLVLTNLNNLQVLFYTSLFATVALFVIICFQKKLVFLKSLTKKEYWRFAYMGFIGVFLYSIFLFGGLSFSSAQEAFIVNYTWPIWVVIFSFFILKEKCNLRKIIGILFGFLGILVVVTKGNIFSFVITNLYGDLLAFAGAISYGLFSILGKKDTVDKFIAMFFYYLFAFVYIGITMLLFSISVPTISQWELAGLLWLGIFASGLAFVFWFLALKYGETAKMSNIVFLTPFLSLVFIYFILHEPILVSSII